MLEDFRSFDSFLGIDFEHSSKEVKSLGINILVKRTMEIELHLLVGLVYLVSFFTLEKLLPHKQNMENGTQWKNVAFWFDVVSLHDSGDLRGNIARSSTSVEDVIFSVSIGGQAEINDDWIEASFSPKHDVFGFDISMHDSVVMHFFQSKSHTLDELPNLTWVEDGFFIVNTLVELAVWKEFQDDVERVFRLKDSFAFDDMRWIECPEHLNFV